MVTSAGRTVEDQDNAGVTLYCANQFMTEQLRRELPDIRKKAQAFFKKDLQIRVEMLEAAGPAEKKPRPSEVRANVMKSPVVKEILSEFNGVVRDVKPGE